MNRREYLQAVLRTHGRLALRGLTPERCTASALLPLLDTLIGSAPSHLHPVPLGRSVEGRVIRAVQCGTGGTRVMLWSQMHGDEPTGTLALADILRMITARGAAGEQFRPLREKLSMVFVPMVNPDGARRHTRHNSLGIDVNRDARALASPEARLLMRLYETVRPHFAFNLHDQSVASAGVTTTPATLALLAPPADGRRDIPACRRKAMLVGAAIADGLAGMVPEGIAVYDDQYEPRAFGEAFQALGTSTLLIESGHWLGDARRSRVRSFTAGAILVGLQAIADGSYRTADIRKYTALPPNGTRVFDVLVRRVSLRHPSGWAGSVDVGLLASRNSRSGSGVFEIKEVGDLKSFGAVRTFDARGRVLAAEAIVPGRKILLPAFLGRLKIRM